MDSNGKFTKVLENMRKGIEGSFYIEKAKDGKQRVR
jgi:hypothetical protein